MTKTLKKPAAKAVAPEPAPPARFEFHPELSPEWSMDLADPPGTFTISIYREGEAPNLPIATVQVNPMFSERSQLHIANLISHAPELWQALHRQLPRLAFSDLDDLREFGDVLWLLRCASERTPISSVEDSEESRLEAVNTKTIAALAGKVGAA